MIWFKLSSGEGENKVLMTNVSGIEDVKRKGTVLIHMCKINKFLFIHYTAGHF